MSVYTYDNRATMRRECWQDGKIIHSYSARVVMEARIPAEHFFFGANVGEWSPGNITGDEDAKFDRKSRVSRP